MVETEKPSYKIVGLQAENFKRLSAVSIAPDGNVVQIAGKNGQGKSSILDSIWAALGGANAAPPVPIRRGEETAVIKLDLGELRITRKFRLKEDDTVSTSLIVESPHGARYNSPQEVLNAIVGELAFDPIAFSRKSAKDQFEAIRRLVPNIDFDALKAANKQDFDERTIQNRKAKDARAQAAGIAPAAGIEPVGDIAALEADYAKALEHNAEISKRSAARESARAQVAAYDQQIAELAAKRDELNTKLAEAPELPEPVPIDSLKEQLEKARANRQAAENAHRYKELVAEADRAQAHADRLTKAIEEREALKRETIAQAKLPIEGLSIGDDVVLLNDLPLEQASSAQQWAVGVSIATALNPRLRVIFIRDGSLLDADAMKWLGDFAAANDLQVWIERVDPSGGVGFIIEDGHIKGQEPPAKPEPATPAEQEGEMF